MTTYNDAITKLFSEKEKLVIIGLTGRTGSGCSVSSLYQLPSYYIFISFCIMIYKIFLYYLS